jgi:diguanylate cyclase (GGDEF)-like protein/PAS domain S-box-containing protein
MARPFQKISEKPVRKERRRTQRPLTPAQDIPGRSRIWQALLESEDRFRATFDYAPVGIMHTSIEDDRILHANARLATMLGYAPGELFGMTADEIRHPDGRGTNRHRRHNKVLLGELETYSSERMYRRQDGSPLWLNRTVSLVRDAEGKPHYFISMMEDINERKQALEAAARERVLLRTIIDTVPDYIYVKDAQGRFMLANQSWLKARGRPDDDIAGKTVFDFFARDMAEKMEAQDAAVVRTGVPMPEREQRIILNAPDGRPDESRWAAISKVPMRDPSGKIIGTVGISRDITERKLIALRQEMEHAVTKVISEAVSVDDAMPKLLDTICRAMNWAYGARWICNDEEGMVRSDFWADFTPEFDLADRELWTRQGLEGSMVLLRRAWRQNEPTWIADIAQHPSFRRQASSRKLGLHSAFAFPIVAGGCVVGVMEFFGRETRQPDAMLLQVVSSIGSQIGQFIQRKEAEQALRTSEERYRDVFEASPLPMWVWDDETLDILAVNQAASTRYGYSRDEFLRMNVRDVWAPGEATRYERNIRNRTREQTLQMRRKHRTKDGAILDTEVTARLFTLDGRPVWLTLVNDVSERVRAEAALRESEEQFRQLAGNIPQVFWITDTSHRQTLYVSPAAETMLGRPLQDILSDPRALVRAVHKADRARVYSARKSAVESGYDETYRIVRADGSTRWVHDRAFPVRDGDGRVYRIAGIAEDVTDRKHAEERLEHLAHYDVMTNLPNRVLFYDRLKHALVQAKRNRWTMGIMFIDVDRFKNVNDTLGHAIGDDLLQQIAGRLTRSVRSGDTVGRLGGDEFSIVLSTLASAQDVNIVAQKIMTAFNEPFRLEGTEVYVTVSIGITLFPDDSSDQDILIRNADAAMYRAKELGRNSYQFYTPEMNASAVRFLGMESGLRHALERNEFLMYYQPKASVADGDMTGLEALLRWRHPERGLVSPAEFIPLLEETGFIIQVGEWVLRAVCSQIKAWEHAGVRPVPVAVNLSARQFAAKDLGPSIRRILEEHQVDPTLIELEITESSLMANIEEAARTLEYLDRLGVSLSIDDFGTGYSSLGYLKRFPLSALKIDRTFVRDITSDGDDATITRAVISMAHNLGLKVIAEGVETRAQLEFLAEYGCNEIQGYYFSHPMAAEDCSAWLRERRRLDLPRPASDSSVPVVLLLDDEENTLAHFQRILAKDGYRILAARNAREGLALLRDHLVDVVVSDQNMPGMSGVDFLQCVQSLSPKTMRILTTRYADFKTMAAAVNKGGIFRCLSKDGTDEVLRASVREAVQAKSLSARESSVARGATE